MTVGFREFIPSSPERPIVVDRSGYRRTPDRFVGRPSGLYSRGWKRVLDVVLVLLAAPVVVPVVLLMAVLVRRDGGPAFYAQERLAAPGRTFRIWKLRSMVVDADTALERHLQSDPDARREWNSTQKLRSDPRVTRLGRFLRKVSIDELPQLWNVLRGDMSLVGPRPMMPEQERLYPGPAYFGLRPGITGYWQTSARNETTFAARADFDADYRRDLSLATDLRILLRTVVVVLRGTGC